MHDLILKNRVPRHLERAMVNTQCETSSSWTQLHHTTNTDRHMSQALGRHTQKNIKDVFLFLNSWQSNIRQYKLETRKQFQSNLQNML